MNKFMRTRSGGITGSASETGRARVVRGGIALFAATLAGPLGCASILGFEHEYVREDGSSGGGGSSEISSSSQSSNSSGPGSGSSSGGMGGAGGAVSPTCGNGSIEPGEDCDDGNMMASDGCSPSCKHEQIDACPGVNVPLVAGTQVMMSSTTSGASAGASGTCGGGLSADHVYAVTPSASGTLEMVVSHGFNAIAYVRTECDVAAVPAELRCEHSTDPIGMSIWVEAGKTYFVYIDGDMGDSGAYTLLLDLYACGDGVKQGLEQCDDADADPNDGCAGCISCNGPGEIVNSTTRHCYVARNTPLPWAEARQDCVKWGGDLMALSTQDEFTSAINACSADRWLGGNDITQEGVYTHANGEPWFAVWEPGEPDGLEAEDCVELRCDKQAYTEISCAISLPYVCERAPAP